MGPLPMNLLGKGSSVMEILMLHDLQQSLTTDMLCACRVVAADRRGSEEDRAIAEIDRVDIRWRQSQTSVRRNKPSTLSICWADYSMTENIHHCMELELVDRATSDGSFQAVDCGNDQALAEWIGFSSCCLVQRMHQTNPSMENLDFELLVHTSHAAEQENQWLKLVHPDNPHEVPVDSRRPVPNPGSLP